MNLTLIDKKLFILSLHNMVFKLIRFTIYNATKTFK